MNIHLVLSILFVHWIADFVVQTDRQAKEKSSNSWQLTRHVFSYTLCFFVAFALFAAYQNHIGHLSASSFGLTPTICFFFPITFVCHWATDYVTSRVNAMLWRDKRVHLFFVSIGFDQFLHFSQLLLTIHFLIN